MKLRLSSAVAIIAAGSIWAWTAIDTAAQGRAKTPAASATVGRTSDGQPDIQGYWQINGVGIASLEAGGYRPTPGLDVAVSDARAANARRTDLPTGIIDPPDGKLLLQPWAAERKKTFAASNLDPKGKLEMTDPMSKCYPSGVPRFHYSTGYNGYQFIQTPGAVVMIGEWNHQQRLIPVDGRAHLNEKVRLWMGDSRGRWEGNTLVVDVTNFQGENWLDMSGTITSDALHVVERYRIVDANTIAYEATIDDPKVYTRPWKMAGYFSRGEPGYQMYEYACHEGNHFLRMFK